MTGLQPRHPNLMAVLQGRGYRATVPRKIIVSLMERKRDGFTAKGLCEELPSVGRATVFRTLKLFLEAGVLCKLETMGGSPIYSLCRDGHHHHSLCVRCGAVGDFRAATVERLVKGLSDEIPGQVVGHRIELFVDCKQCPRNGN